MVDDEPTTDPTEPPPVVVIKVVCKACGQELRNLGAKYVHTKPLSEDDEHAPEPVQG
jgi:hypothetical protein